MATSSVRSVQSKPLLAAWPGVRWRCSVRRRLLRWYDRHQRDLPWRKTSDPYCIWLSEIMLQQTQVATVIPYYLRFIGAMPDVASLAAAPEQDVLRLWEGLGYYRRARQLHRAAQVIATDHAGEFPRDFDAILDLPGIGRYTAGAIASIAFDQSAPILEANTVRLYSRLIGLRGDTSQPASHALLWKFAEEIVPRRGARLVNQALMELGSLVCTPVKPRCDECPLRDQCAAARHNLQQEIPAPKKRPVIEDVREATVVVWRGGKVLIRQRSAGERWAGMWDFPRFRIDQINSELYQALADHVIKQTEVVVKVDRQLTTIKHGITRFRITLECYEARCDPAVRLKSNPALQWLTPTDLHTVALSVPARKLARLIAE
jgi:A/G-specific adenine glycosylase